MAYSRDIYRRVQDELLRRRDTALSEAQARREEVPSKNKELKMLDDALSHTAMHLFEAATSGANAKARMEEVRRENEALLDEAKRLVMRTLQEILRGRHVDHMRLKTRVRDDLSKFLYAKTGRKPMVLPVVMDV